MLYDILKQEAAALTEDKMRILIEFARSLTAYGSVMNIFRLMNRIQ